MWYEVVCINYLDSEFGCDTNPIHIGWYDKATAKSIVRNLNKKAPEFIFYQVRKEEWRWT